jgi:Cu-Zn family superoxide dismutase
MNRHAGALFNLKTDAQGVGVLNQKANTITLTDGKYSIIGKPLITHRDPDDYKSQPLGNAGTRVSCGLITKA